jgi:hypothetical protein
MSNANLQIESKKKSPSLRSLTISCIVIAVLLRLGLSFISFGSNDARIWQLFAESVFYQGLMQSYRTIPSLNHPPLPVLWAAFSLWAGKHLWFSAMMKFPAILADAGAIALLAHIWAGRGDIPRARLAVIVMSFSPVAILISGYHCNTDSVYAFLTLLSMYFFTDRKQFFYGGLALAGAINVKLVPVFLIPAAFSLCTSWREARLLFFALAIGAIPFLPLLANPQIIRQNMLNYVPPISNWGIGYIVPDLFYYQPKDVARIMDFYRTLGRWTIIASVICLSFAQFRWRRWNGYEIATILYCALLVFAPGFGPQYTIIVVPVMLAVLIGRSLLYSMICGGFLLMSYWSRLVSYYIPLESIFTPDTRTSSGASLGLLAWFVLLETGVFILLHDHRKKTSPAHCSNDLGNK